MRYFLVECMQGHFGNKRYQPIVFAIAADNAVHAMDLAKQMPGVKHSRPVLSCRETTLDVYQEYRQVSAYKRREENSWASQSL